MLPLPHGWDYNEKTEDRAMKQDYETCRESNHFSLIFNYYQISVSTLKK